MSKVDEYLSLKERIKAIELKIVADNEKRNQLKNQLNEILSKYGVSSVEELREKNRSSTEYANKVLSEVEEKVASMEALLNKA